MFLLECESFLLEGIMAGCLPEQAKSIMHGVTHAFLQAVVEKAANVPQLDVGQVKLDPQRFIVAFCGSGTGHLTQAFAVVKLQQSQGMTLAGVVTDTCVPLCLSCLDCSSIHPPDRVVPSAGMQTRRS